MDILNEKCGSVGRSESSCAFFLSLLVVHWSKKFTTLANNVEEKFPKFPTFSLTRPPDSELRSYRQPVERIYQIERAAGSARKELLTGKQHAESTASENGITANRHRQIWQQGPASFNITAKTDVCTLPINMPNLINFSII